MRSIVNAQAYAHVHARMLMLLLTVTVTVMTPQFIFSVQLQQKSYKSAPSFCNFSAATERFYFR